MIVNTNSTNLVSNGANTSSFNVIRPSTAQNFPRRFGHLRSRLRPFDVFSIDTTPSSPASHTIAEACRLGEDVGGKRINPDTYPPSATVAGRARGPGERMTKAQIRKASAFREA